jgi:hypothetical protein
MSRSAFCHTRVSVYIKREQFLCREGIEGLDGFVEGFVGTWFGHAFINASVSGRARWGTACWAHSSLSKVQAGMRAIPHSLVVGTEEF